MKAYSGEIASGADENNDNHCNVRYVWTSTAKNSDLAHRIKMLQQRISEQDCERMIVSSTLPWVLLIPSLSLIQHKPQQHSPALVDKLNECKTSMFLQWVLPFLRA